MMMKSLRITIVCLLAVLILSGAVCAQERPALLDSLHERYETLNDLAVEFKQEVHSGVFATVDRTEGWMYLAGRDKFRVQTEEQTIVSNGELLWVYNRDNAQVTIDKVEKAHDLVRPSDYIFSFRDAYSSELLPDTTIDGTRCTVVFLDAAANDEFIQEMTLFISGKDRLTRRAEYLDINGNTVVIDFLNLKIDEGISDDIFKFKTPEGVEEVRLP